MHRLNDLPAFSCSCSSAAAKHLSYLSAVLARQRFAQFLCLHVAFVHVKEACLDKFFVGNKKVSDSPSPTKNLLPICVDLYSLD